MKALLKATHAWLLKLPPDELAKFKSSGDFELYKRVLKKYGLIK